MTRAGSLTTTLPLRVLAWVLTLSAAPAAILLLAELGLRTAGYGFDLRLFIPRDETGRHLTANPHVARRYFRGENAPRFGSDDVIAAVKGDSTIRVIALGGSTTAGYPYFYNGSFPTLLRTRLEQAWPDYHIEVMNLGMTAITSYTVMDFMAEVREQGPDLLVIYMGHNEFYGVLGSSSTQRVGSSRALTRVYVALSRFRLVQLLKNLVRRLPGTASHEITDRGITRMARMVDRDAIAQGGQLYTQTLENYEANLRAVLRRARGGHIPVVVGTLVSNLGDQPPFISLADDQSVEQSVIRMLDSSRVLLSNGRLLAGRLAAHRAVELDSGYALAWFQLGKAWHLLQYPDSAVICFKQARDLDGLRFRASSDINEIIRRVCLEEGALVADVEAALTALVPSGIVGSNLMLEHLHPNLEGYFQMAAVFARVILEHPDLIVAVPPKSPRDDAWYRQKLTLTPVDLAIARRQIEVLTSGWPFQPGSRGTTYQELTPTGMVDSLALAVLRGRANFWEIHTFLAEHYLRRDEFQAAIDESRALVHAFPHEPASHQRLAQTLISAGYHTEALSSLSALVDLGEERYSSKWRGIILMTQGRDLEALPLLERAKALNPADTQVRYNLGGAYFRTRQLESAFRELDELLALDPDYPGAREFLEQIAPKTPGEYN